MLVLCLYVCLRCECISYAVYAVYLHVMMIKGCESLRDIRIFLSSQFSSQG
jgi:hypothetical protein